MEDSPGNSEFFTSCWGCLQNFSEFSVSSNNRVSSHKFHILHELLGTVESKKWRHVKVTASKQRNFGNRIFNIYTKKTQINIHHNLIQQSRKTNATKLFLISQSASACTNNRSSQTGYFGDLSINSLLRRTLLVYQYSREKT